MNDHQQLFNERQWQTLERAFHEGSAEASQALATWVGKPSVVEIDAIEQLPIAEAGELLGASDELICFCSTTVQGPLSGEMIFGFDDQGGFALADLILSQPPGTTTEWTELAQSAAMETTNILCCAYLNALSRQLSAASGSSELLPTPPRFSREFAGSLMQFAIMGQAMTSDHVVAVRTRFEIDGTPCHWSLLLVPDMETIASLPRLLITDEPQEER